MSRTRHSNRNRRLPRSVTNPAPPRSDEGTTTRPETPALEGIEPLPDEITGRAAGTEESLTTLFDNTSAAHLRDGFMGGSGDVPESVDPTPNAGDEDADGATPARSSEPDGTR